MSLELEGELLRPSHISALKHMHVRKYSCLALFYFIFSNSDYSIMNHLMLFVIVFCLFFHFENIPNDNDEFIEFISLFYYKTNVLSCLLILIIIIIVIIVIIK